MRRSATLAVLTAAVMVIGQTVHLAVGHVALPSGTTVAWADDGGSGDSGPSDTERPDGDGSDRESSNDGTDLTDSGGGGSDEVPGSTDGDGSTSDDGEDPVVQPAADPATVNSGRVARTAPARSARLSRVLMAVRPVAGPVPGTARVVLAARHPDPFTESPLARLPAVLVRWVGYAIGGGVLLLIVIIVAGFWAKRRIFRL